jgi:poly(hydroxyalkanoate) depolymerase family esterase
MNRLSFAVVFFIAGLAAAGFTQSVNFKVDGVTRNLLLHAPSGTNNPALVYVLHGYNIDATMMQNTTYMDRVADKEKFIVVYPNAINKSWDMSDTSHDYKFLLAIIDTMEARYHIDRSRVYVSGFSQGGFMCFNIACKYADVFAAIAPVSGLFSVAQCTPKRPVPTKMTFGTADAATPASFMQSVSKWITVLGCPSTPVITRPYPPSNPNSVVTRLEYAPCKDGAEFVVDSVSGGTHEWVIDTKTKISNSDEIWAFFKKFSLNSTATHPRAAPVGAANRLTASYSGGMVRLLGVEDNCRVRVIDTKGSLLAAGFATGHAFAFKNRPGGVYFITASGKSGQAKITMIILR